MEQYYTTRVAQLECIARDEGFKAAFLNHPVSNPYENQSEYARLWQRGFDHGCICRSSGNLPADFDPEPPPGPLANA